MDEWIIKASTKLYNHTTSLKENGHIDWSQKIDYEIGDIIYVCFVGDQVGIKFKTEESKVKIPFEQITNVENS